MHVLALRCDLAAVSGNAGHGEEVIDSVRRFVRSYPEPDVVDEERTWME
jgi:uncharacterized protein YlxP (DUF503 family)